MVGKHVHIERFTRQDHVGMCGRVGCENGGKVEDVDGIEGYDVDKLRERDERDWKDRFGAFDRVQSQGE